MIRPAHQEFLWGRLDYGDRDYGDRDYGDSALIPMPSKKLDPGSSRDDEREAF